MLSQAEVNRLSAELKIDRERITREFYEILILNDMSKLSWSQNLIFKGGTALRLAYNSPRFSDDLDFSVIQKISAKEVFKFAVTTSRKYGIKIRDQWEKKETIVVEFSITEAIIPQPFGLKIEISKRKAVDINFELKILTSPVSPHEVLFNVQTLESVRQDKLSAIRERDEPRDLFDLWFISQRLGTDFFVDKDTIDNKRMKQVLHKYLPQHWHRAIDEISKKT